jgi:hypothetical protein
MKLGPRGAAREIDGGSGWTEPKAKDVLAAARPVRNRHGDLQFLPRNSAAID